MQKAVFFANYGSPYEGNFIVSLKLLEKRLNLNGINVAYVFPMRTKERDWVGQLKEENNEVFFLSDSKMKAVSEMKNIIEHAAFVHTHFINMEQMLILRLARIISGSQCPVIHHIHNHFENSNNIIKKIVKAWSLHSDYMLACGSGVCDSIKEAGLKNEAAYIDNGIDFERLNHYAESVFAPEGCQILMFGFDYKRKGVDLAVKACQQLRKENKNVHLNISLSRNLEVVEEEIKRILGEVPEWISLLPPRNDIATYYRGADLFISPSREEGLCYSLIEAAYCGCVVVASHISGQYELDIPQLIWCKKDDSGDLANKISEVLDMKQETRQSIIQEQKRAVMEKYSVERWADEVEQYYYDRKIIRRV